MSVPVEVLVSVIRGYQYALSPIVGRQCRFTPSCSHYAIGSLRNHGLFRGGAMASWRILRCNPWCEGGEDPVPQKNSCNPR